MDFQITVTSFGFKYAAPPESDLMFDVRFLPNPFYVEDLKPLCGLDAPVRDYLFSHDVSNEFLTRLVDMVDFIIPYFAAKGRTELRVAVGCTGGRHRSVAVAAALAAHLQQEGRKVDLLHRDVSR